MSQILRQPPDPLISQVLRHRPGPAISIIVPCYNERDNVAPMVAALEAALPGLDWEVIFVDDDSPDGTTEVARAMGHDDARVRCIRRVGRRGLATAVIEGALAANGSLLAVLDGDLQHDETRLLAMFAALEAGADIAVGSRHVDGGSSDGLSSPTRVRLSSLGIRLARTLSGTPLNDPMSGFFALRRSLFEQLAPRLVGQGFKILLDLVLASPTPLQLAEIPYQFRPRRAGASKLDALVMFQFAGLLIDKALGRAIPLRFMSFAAVGGVGVLVNLIVMLLAQHAGMTFGRAQMLGTLVAMVTNFQMNNSLTYRTERLTGERYWRGLVLFMLVCGLGAIANIGIARTLYTESIDAAVSGAAGAVVGVVWNYAMSATLVWRAR
jgi:dolichol-phosphate mannosyltransferase